MNFEPQRFFIGVIDFFSVLLPGALLTYFLMDDAGPRLLGDRYSGLESAEGWVVFFFSSYLLGHFVFLLGSWLLDDRVYDRIRKATYQEQIERLAEGKTLSSGLTRWIAPHMIKPISDRSVRQAVRVKEHYLARIGDVDAVNAFQWSKARLALENPEALATVQRFEADSKFFRSLVVVLGFLIAWWMIYEGRFAVAAVSFGFLLLAFWRYVDQRAKSSDQAYWYIITMEGIRKNSLRQASSANSKGKPSHAGGVVYRQVGDEVQYLLVQAKNAPKEWVLPKGHIKPGETMQETAVREVREESGVWARVTEKLEISEYDVKGDHVSVQFYLMERLKEEKPKEKRKSAWLPLRAAIEQASHPDTRALLSLADQRRQGIVEEISGLATPAKEPGTAS